MSAATSRAPSEWSGHPCQRPFQRLFEIERKFEADRANGHCALKRGAQFNLMQFQALIPSPDLIMGVKAVWGQTPAAVVAFGRHGDSERAKYSLPKSVAGRSFTQPFVITLGGGSGVASEINGRAVEIFKVSGAYGNLAAFVEDERIRGILAQWPVAVALTEVYDIIGHPRLVEDLDLPDRGILSLSFDGVTRFDDRIEQLWLALADHEVIRRPEIGIPGFIPPAKPVLVGQIPPRIKYRSSEGRKLWTLQQSAERDASLSRDVKHANRLRNNGVIICEACGFSDKLGSLFDAHHKNPLFSGERASEPNDFLVLCPTCHRWAHSKTNDPLYPLGLERLRLDRAPRNS